MTGAGADVQVLARIDASKWHDRGHAYREEVRAWLRANGVEPNDLPIEDVQIALLDAPAIVRREVVRDENGRVQRDLSASDDDWWVLTRVVHSLLRVPLPEHLADPL